MLEGYKFSPFVHFFQRKDVVCIYHAIEMSSLYLNENVYKQLLSFLNHKQESVIPPKYSKIIKKLIQNNVLVRKSFSAKRYIKSIVHLLVGKPHIRVMVLHMTDVCNLSCKYCFIEGNIKSGYRRRDMSEEVIEKAIDKFVQITCKKKFKKRPAIVFYGGEPLANWQVMLHGLEYLDKKYHSFEVDKVIITNGTLVTPEIAKNLKKYGVDVALSIDGPRDCHNANRVYRNGKGTFDDVIKGLEIMRKAGLTPSASCVMSKETVQKADKVIQWLIEDLHINSLGFNHVSIVPSLNYYDEKYENDFADAILKVQDIIQEKYPHVYERRMNHKINCFLDKLIVSADCTGCGEQFSVSTTGEVGICQGYMGSRKTFNNSVFDDAFDPNEDEVFIEWSSRSPFTMPECYSCPALSTCGGGCPRNADVLSGSIWKRDLPFCHFAKKAQEWIIWRQFDYDKEHIEYIDK